MKDRATIYLLSILILGIFAFLYFGADRKVYKPIKDVQMKYIKEMH